ncbi:MAG: hypothetical protein AVDCRST_MAG10-3105, partial [uncultured Acidimicrobiales bacterium]
ERGLVSHPGLVPLHSLGGARAVGRAALHDRAGARRRSRRSQWTGAVRCIRRPVAGMGGRHGRRLRPPSHRTDCTTGGGPGRSRRRSGGRRRGASVGAGRRLGHGGLRLGVRSRIRGLVRERTGLPQRAPLPPPPAGTAAAGPLADVLGSFHGRHRGRAVAARRPPVDPRRPRPPRRLAAGLPPAQGAAQPVAPLGRVRAGRRGPARPDGALRPPAVPPPDRHLTPPGDGRRRRHVRPVPAGPRPRPGHGARRAHHHHPAEAGPPGRHGDPRLRGPLHPDPPRPGPRGGPPPPHRRPPAADRQRV